MKKKSSVSIEEVSEALQDLYWTLHRHSKASNEPAKLEWLQDKTSDVFDSTGCISGYEFEKFMPKARKLIQRFLNEKKVKP